MKRIILFMAAVFGSVAMLHAQEVAEVAKVSADAIAEESVAKETRFLPMRQRVDRNVGDNKFVYKGEWMLGIAASYGTLDVSDTDLMLLFDNIDFSLRRAAVMPYVAYSYRDNQAVGLRFGYEYLQGDLGNLELNLGSAADISFGLGDIGLKSESYAWSIFHRYFFCYSFIPLFSKLCIKSFYFKEHFCLSYKLGFREECVTV